MPRGRSKLGPRIDLPPYEPWSKEPWAPTRREVVEAMQHHRVWPRQIAADRLVPEDVRTQSAERWRIEHERLLAAESEQGRDFEAQSHRWAAWCTRAPWQRLIDVVFWETAPLEPRKPGPGHAPFAIMTIRRHQPAPPFNPSTGDVHSRFECPMPRDDGEP